jgi:hypothetical protein
MAARQVAASRKPEARAGQLPKHLFEAGALGGLGDAREPRPHHFGERRRLAHRRRAQRRLGIHRHLVDGRILEDGEQMPPSFRRRRPWQGGQSGEHRHRLVRGDDAAAFGGGEDGGQVRRDQLGTGGGQRIEPRHRAPDQAVVGGVERGEQGARVRPEEIGPERAELVERLDRVAADGPRPVRQRIGEHRDTGAILACGERPGERGVGLLVTPAERARQPVEHAHPHLPRDEKAGGQAVAGVEPAMAPYCHARAPLAPPPPAAILAARQQEAAAIRLPSFLLAAAFATLAAAPPLAAKPPAGGGGADAGDAYRERGIALCVADLRIVADLSGDDLEGICGCALGRFMDSRPASALPPLGPSRFRGVMESELFACTAELRPDRTGEVAARGMAPPDATAGAKPAPAPAGPAADAPRSKRGDPGAWLRARLAALPTAAWVAIGFLILLLLGALIRRRDDRRDLLGPPPSMRQVASPRPKPFRLEL